VMEYMRQLIYGYDPVNDRVERVLTVINLKDYYKSHAN